MTIVFWLCFKSLHPKKKIRSSSLYRHTEIFTDGMLWCLEGERGVWLKQDYSQVGTTWSRVVGARVSTRAFGLLCIFHSQKLTKEHLYAHLHTHTPLYWLVYATCLSRKILKKFTLFVGWGGSPWIAKSSREVFCFLFFLVNLYVFFKFWTLWMHSLFKKVI